ncbi:hypothetical protein BB559_000285 [Furculomyces boomerangus]|uniref:Uncharacterized protein n=2 Tax=Harpellales TaxID=61421 RepID=A0A2T9Z5Q0_9FUNG|nr:hypothetical protein BB559_000285 [Furculomyces boomerangus]PWA02028.1 hypothetical protein BB558_001836 [Smittium angustum]
MDSSAVVLEYANLDVRYSDFNSLKPAGWLTGEIINFYLTQVIISLQSSPNHFPFSNLLFYQWPSNEQFTKDKSKHNYKFDNYPNAFNSRTYYNTSQGFTNNLLSQGISNLPYSSKLSLKVEPPSRTETGILDRNINYNINRNNSSIDNNYDEQLCSKSSSRCSAFPKNFWRVIEEDIEYPHSMRIRLQRLVVSLKKQT